MFRVQPHAARTISWWITQRDKTDFSPPYQRKGNLWGDKDKAYLIDSIINGYDIPKIYMADFTFFDSSLNSKRLPYAIIDGRQRMESIVAFRNGSLSLNEDFVFHNDPSINISGYTFSEIRSEHPEIAEIFEQFNLDVMSVITDEEEKIRDLFVRLNRSKALTGAELRNAMEGIVPDLIRGLSDRHFFKHCVKFNTARGQDYNVAAKLLLIEYQEKFVDTKKKQLDQLVRLGAVTDNPEPLYEAAFRAEKIIQTMEVAFRERDPLLGTHGLIPLYYELFKLPHSPEVIREFIEYFSIKRKENQEITKSDPEKSDPIFLSFDAAVRSINDSGSLISAFKIMKDRLMQFSPNG